MIANTDEGELIIQSSEITSTVPSYVYVRPLNHVNVHVRRHVRQSPEPVLWNPNQGNHSRFLHDLWSSISNSVYNGPISGVRMIKSSLQVGGHDKDNTHRAFIVVGAIFVTSLVALCYIYMKFPELEPGEIQHVKIPWDIEDAKQLGRVLDRYKDKYYFEVLLTLVVTYLFLQTFAIPGSISLSILSGFLFPFPLALLVVCFCSATGASLCYALSFFLGRRLVYKYFPEKASQWALTIMCVAVLISLASSYIISFSIPQFSRTGIDSLLGTVNKHRGNLLNYILFLRMTPFLPNWFINITAPIINVPLFPFWIGTFIGVAPPSFLAIQAGQTLYTLSASSDAWSWTSVILLGVFAVLSLVPVFLQKQLKEAVE